MTRSSLLHCRIVALSFAAAVICAAPALAQSNSQQNSATGCYSGKEDAEAKYAQGCAPPPGTQTPAAVTQKGPGTYSGKEDASAKGNAGSGEGCAPPPGTSANAQDLAKALQQTNTKYDQDCAAAYKNQNQ